MTAPIIRRAGPPDAACLALLGGATFLAAFAHDHPGEAIVAHVTANHSLDWYAQALADPDRALWIVETPLGAPLGYAMLALPKLAFPTGAGDLELLRLYMLPGWQGGGIGERLIDAVEAEAVARGAERLLLCVYSANLRAQAFYARRGFADTGARQAFWVGDVPFDDQIWLKQIARASG